MTDLRLLADALAPHGLILRGGFRPVPDDGLDDIKTVALVGNAGPAMWDAFARSIPAGPNPMDAWTRATVDPIAEQIDATAAYPFEGPPYRPFQRWALRCDDVHVSPIGVLIHPVFGPWHAYRAALLLRDRIDVPVASRGESPCRTCETKPCIAGCPVNAFGSGGYDVPACTAHIRSSAGADCMACGCLARHACPVGADYRFANAQSAFHMTAFERAR